MDRRIKFRHVQCFVQISREASFKRAAERLNLTQPAVSRTIKELEEILGRTLLIRDRGGVELTHWGARFVRHAQATIASLQQGVDSVSDQVGQGSLSVGVLPSVAARLIPSAAEAFRQALPDAVLRLWDGPQGFLLDRLKAGRIDFVVGRMGAHEQMRGVTFAPLYRERVCFVVRIGHPLLDRPSLEAIEDWPVVYPSEGSAIRPVIDRFLRENGIGSLPRRIETVSGAFGREHVQRSDAVWIISEGVVANEIARGVLARLPIDTNATVGSIGIMAREDAELGEEARCFRTILRTLADAAQRL